VFLKSSNNCLQVKGRLMTGGSDFHLKLIPVGY
jgi:hypothetical protein